MLSWASCREPSRLGKSTVLSPSTIALSDLRDGSLSGFEERRRAASDAFRSSRSSATTASIVRSTGGAGARPARQVLSIGT